MALIVFAGSETGEARWKWTGEFTAGAVKLRDAVESHFAVGYPTPLLREVRQARADGDADLQAYLAAHEVEREREVRRAQNAAAQARQQLSAIQKPEVTDGAKAAVA